MSIDTKAKRMSMLYMASPVTWGAHFEVDGAVDADDRAHLLHLYGGNALGAPVAVVAAVPPAWRTFAVYPESRTYAVEPESRTYAVYPESRTFTVH